MRTTTFFMSLAFFTPFLLPPSSLQVKFHFGWKEIERAKSFGVFTIFSSSSRSPQAAAASNTHVASESKVTKDYIMYKPVYKTCALVVILILPIRISFLAISYQIL